jgi:hypothetical protein
MSKRITHDMSKERELVFEYSTGPAYLAVVDLDSYNFFVKEGLDYYGMLAHLGEEMNQRKCIAWGCPEQNLRVRIILARDHQPPQAMTEYASGFQRWIRTRGRLCFTSHADLYHCATNSEWSVFKGPESPDVFLPRELALPSGMYAVTVFRHFGWLEGSQDAPLLNEGVHYTINLRHYADESQLGRMQPPSAVPWT